jgi:hypothetical protein
MNSMKKKEEEKPAAPPAPSAEETLLTEIRDLLKKDSGLLRLNIGHSNSVNRPE